MRLFSVPSFHWKRRSPRAAAQLHLDSSLPERQACCTHCPDSYLCNCVPVREERRWSWQQHCPCSKTEDMLQWRLWSAGAFSSTIKRDIGAALSALTYIQAPDVSERVPLVVLGQQATASSLRWVTGPATISVEQGSSSQECSDNVLSRLPAKAGLINRHLMSQNPLHLRSLAFHKPLQILHLFFFLFHFHVITCKLFLHYSCN